MTCAQDLDVELAKPARRNVAPPAQPDDSSDRSEETGIASLEAGATDAVPALAPAAQSAAKRAKSKAAPAVKASAGGCDVDSAKALKVAKPAASAKKTAQAAPAKAEVPAPASHQQPALAPPSPPPASRAVRIRRFFNNSRASRPLGSSPRHASRAIAPPDPVTDATLVPAASPPIA